jgi:hypothetical protein
MNPTVSTLADLHKCMGEPLTLTNLRSIMLLLTRSHFSKAQNFGAFEKNLECYVYDDDPKTSQISIGLDFIPSDENPSPRPAVWVGLLPVKFGKVVFNNFAGSSDDNSRSDHTKIQIVPVKITCVADSSDIALAMAETLASFFMGMREHIMSKLQLHMFEVEEISQLRIKEKQPEQYFEVDVTMTMTFSCMITANIESHRLKQFVLDVEF